MQSLSHFSQAWGLNKGTVYRKCRELKIDTANGLSDEAVAKLKAAFNLKDPTPDTPSATSVTVDAGNHHLVLAPPTMPQVFSLESLRSSEVTAYDDPLEVANRALAIADQIQAAMDADLKARQERLQATKQANEELQKRIQTMRLNQLKYEIQASTLDSATTDRTISLQDSLAELARLGKPAAETPAPGA